MTNTISAEALRAALLDDEELALVDVREVGAFSRAHLLWANCIPFSQLELRVDALIPRRSTRIVLCDADESLASLALRRLSHLGYAHVEILEGGINGWTAAGMELFSGVNVPSKAFGEFVEHTYDTPNIDAEDLHQRLEAGDNLVVVDSRPMREFRAMSLPAGTCMPGAELAYRVHEIAPDPNTTVVVNCAGRTRSIIGAQSLINAGIPNPVMALRNGTMAWHMAGFPLDRGGERYVDKLSDESLARAHACAERVARRFGVRYIDLNDLDELRAEDEYRNLFLLDVRSPEEFAAGHLPDSRNAPGGQLVQATDEYVGVLGARIVLTDNDGVRATMTASWLLQLGWREVYVLEGVSDADFSEQGEERQSVLGLGELDVELISAPSLARLREEGRVNVVDLSSSRHFMQAHVEGARHAVRSRLHELIPVLPARPWLVFTCEDGVLSRLAAADSDEPTDARVAALMGGNATWADNGFTMVSGGHGMDEHPDDVWMSPYDQTDRIEDAMNAYLDWEIALVDQIERDGTTRFRRF